MHFLGETEGFSTETQNMIAQPSAYPLPYCQVFDNEERDISKVRGGNRNASSS